MNDIYAEFVENFMAIPVIKGTKSENERFAGALETYCIEALMQDGKALQAGTSHFLGQNFAKAFDVKFTSKEGKQEYVWATSWGVSTRLIGALIMTHSDDQGLVLPPNLAPIQVVIVPIYKGEEQLEQISVVANEMVAKLRAEGISVKYDNRDTYKPGWKFAQYELQGVPVRIAIGPKDLEKGSVELARRDTLSKEVVPQEMVVEKVKGLMIEIQENLFERAKNYRDSHITEVENFEEFKEVLGAKGGFISAHWDGTSETELKIKDKTKATIRLIPMDGKMEEGKCILTGNPSSQRVLFAKAY
jgi:prolyl-tRNA synthetase